MKVLILAGGLGTRISEETTTKPKPMVEIGGKPIIWHIMKMYAHYGFTEFVILLGYKGYYIKEYFSNYFLHQNNITIDLQTNTLTSHNNLSEPWKVTLLDTGDSTMTGGRIKRAKEYINNQTFLLTYGDGVANVDIVRLIRHHRKHKNIVTLSAVQPEGRFGALNIQSDSSISSFMEKPKGDQNWINGGFFVCEPEVFNYIKDDTTTFEHQPLKQLANENRLGAYLHSGFWKCMDTLSDKNTLNEMWGNDKAEWKIWEDHQNQRSLKTTSKRQRVERQHSLQNT